MLKSAVGDDILGCEHFQCSGVWVEGLENMPIDWKAPGAWDNTMVWPVKASEASAVGDAEVIVRQVSCLNFPTFCIMFGQRFTASELDAAWNACPLVRKAKPPRGTHSGAAIGAGQKKRQRPRVNC